MAPTVHELKRTRFIKPIPAELIELDDPVRDGEKISWHIPDCFGCAEYFEGLNGIYAVDGKFIPMSETDDSCSLYALYDTRKDEVESLSIVYDSDCFSFEIDVQIDDTMQKVLLKKMREALLKAQ